MSDANDFVWGVASSAYQTEGAWNVDGKGPSIWDEFSSKRNKILNNERADTAASFYTLHQQDLDIIAALQIKNFRWSVSWPRVIPNGYGHRNHKGIDFYDRLTDECLSRNITPWVTLYHWDLPQALENKGGWTNRNIVDWYSEYVVYVVKKLGDRVKNWMSLNEPLAFTGAGYFLGVHAPGKRGMQNFLPAMHHASLAQAEGIRLVKQYCNNANAGTTFSCTMITPSSENSRDLAAVKRVDALLNRLFIEPLIGRGYPLNDLPFLQRIEKYIKDGDEQKLIAIPDFAGIQNYTREVVSHSWFTPYIQAKIITANSRKVERTAMKWEIYPAALGSMIKKFDAYAEIPSIIVTENGAAFPDTVSDGAVHDFHRTQYLQNHLSEVLSAKKSGYKVNGYFVWSLTDNFEWTEGYHPRFGLVHVDFHSQRRIIKSSGHWYSRFVRSQIPNEIQENHSLLKQV
jgi:beta-glucosidase